MRRFVQAAALAAVALLGVRAAPCQAARPASFSPELGLASWYGEPFHGRKTASGETFDMAAMTAAHKTLPFGTLVLVTNLDNGLRVVVRINDRGPFIAGRIIDLSKAAGALLGLDRTGTARVEIRPAPVGSRLGSVMVEGGGATPGLAPSTSQGAFPDAPVARRGGVRIQVGSYRDAAHARRAVESLGGLGLKAIIETAGAYHRVALYVQESERAHVEALLDKAGWKDRLVSRPRS